MENKGFYDSDTALAMVDEYNKAPAKKSMDLLLLFALIFSMLDI